MRLEIALVGMPINIADMTTEKLHTSIGRDSRGTGSVHIFSAEDDAAIRKMLKLPQECKGTFMEQFNEFQNKVMQTAVNAMQQFDPQKFSEQLINMQDNIMKGMDVLLNLKPEDVASDTLEKDVVLTVGKMRLFHYKPLAPARKRIKTPLMITYALVNRQYMMDLQPDRSVIKSFLEAGLDVYIIDWGYPTAEDMYLTMDDYINWYMDEAVDAIRKETGKDAINLLGV